MKKKVLISTGGSGGHVIPATIFYDHLEHEYDTLITTDLRGSKYLDKNLYKFIVIDTPKLDSIYLLPLKIFVILYLSVKSFYVLRNNNIEILISTGGYMSLPLLIASKLISLKIYLYEPNLVLGRANKLFLNFCDKIFCYSKEVINFPEKSKKKIIILERLVRKEYYQKLQTKEKTKRINLLVVGGSQGASIFDNLIKEVIVEISKNCSIKIIQQTDKKNIENLKSFYSQKNIQNEIFSYNKNFLSLASQTDLSITRAGASTLAELAILNIPFLAIPLPSAKDNHQYENAMFYKNKNCCWIINQKDINKEKLKEFLINILSNEAEYLKKKNNLKNLNYQNTWINVNQKILNTIDENRTS